jgi:Lipoprotein amino terminal region
MYEISPLAKTLVTRDHQQWTKLCGKNKDYLEVIKTWNYTNCERLEQSNYGISGAENCIPGSNECGRFWSVSKSLITS